MQLVRLLPLEILKYPFMFAEALSKLKCTIFSWELNCILHALVALSDGLEEMQLAGI